jgi:hypothetical protein
MRIVNRLLAFIVAVALLGVSVIVIVEVIGYAINGESVLVPWMTWEQWAERTHFNSTVIKVWSIILIVAGAILLIAELKPRRVTRVGLQSDSRATETAITTKGIAAVAKAATSEVDGIGDSSASASRRRVSVTATSATKEKTDAQVLTAPVTTAVQTRLDSLDMQQQPRLSVHVKPRRR